MFFVCLANAVKLVYVTGRIYVARLDFWTWKWTLWAKFSALWLSFSHWLWWSL